MSIVPSEITPTLIASIKAKARILADSDASLNLTQAREQVCKELGFRSWQHACNTKTNFDRLNQSQGRLEKVSSFVNFEKGTTTFFDMDIFHTTPMTNMEFLAMVEKIAYFRESEDKFGSWYVTDEKDIEDLQALHDIVNGVRPAALRERRHIFAIEISSSLAQWFKINTFNEVKEQISWALAYLMMTDSSKVAIVTRQTKGLAEIQARALQVYARYKNKFADKIVMTNYKFGYYAIETYSAFDQFMKAEIGYGIDSVMKVARTTKNRSNNRFDFGVTTYGLRQDDWKGYFVDKTDTSQLLRAESNQEVLDQWVSEFKKRNLSTISPKSHYHGPKFVVANKKDPSVLNKWFYHCDKNQLPYVYIENKVKYCQVTWDFINFNDRDFLVKNEKRIKNRLLLLHRRFSIKNTESRVSTSYTYYKNIYIEDGQKLAEEIFDFLYGLQSRH